jgi:hypothetical protein
MLNGSDLLPLQAVADDDSNIINMNNNHNNVNSVEDLSSHENEQEQSVASFTPSSEQPRDSDLTRADQSRTGAVNVAMDVGMEVWRFWDNMYICSHV